MDPMKFSEMTYTRPDIDALLADCKADRKGSCR